MRIDNKKLREELDILIKNSNSGGAGGPPGGGASGPGSADVSVGPGAAAVAAGPDISMYHNMLSFQQDQLQNLMRCANSNKTK